jgi:hypothetical protein
MGLSVSTGLTTEQYRKRLDQDLVQTQTQLRSLLGQPEGLPPRPKRATPVIQPRKGAAYRISMIEELSEAEGEGSSVNGHTRSNSTPTHSIQSRSDSKRNLPRRILHRLVPLRK